MIAITGASGFIGKALFSELVSRGYLVRGVVRASGCLPQVSGGSFEIISLGDINGTTDWSVALRGVKTVVHYAALAHVIHKNKSDALAAYCKVNVEGTRRLAEQAALLGVERLIFLSSIVVLGINTNNREPFFVSDIPTPVEPYGLSKWKAEQALWEISAKTGLGVVVVRPPLVYGQGVKGNFLRLLRLISTGFPPPLGAIVNWRSLVGLDNLIDLLICCVEYPAAAGQTFLVSDGGRDLSTPELIGMLARMMGKSPHLLSVPLSWLRMTGNVTGKITEIERLTSSLQVDISHTLDFLQWRPPVPVTTGLQKMVDWYLQQR